MKTKVFAGSMAVVVAITVSGCAQLTPQAQTRSRITERAAVFNALRPQQQANILGGAIERGNTTDMVYMALGKPSKIVTSADGVRAMWVYVEYYAPRAAFTTSFNSPNSTQYIPTVTGLNAPGGPGRGAESFNAPLHHEGGPSYLRGMELGATNNPTPNQSLVVPDLQSKTVYVFFQAGKVAEIKLDGDASDQVTVAANVPGSK